MKQLVFYGEPEEIKSYTYEEKIDRAIETIRLASKMSEQYYGKPIICAYSGGKDSDVTADLCVKSGVEVEFIHSITTIDAPETMRHIRRTFKRLEAMGYHTEMRWPELPMWKLIPQKLMPPTRKVRYCCAYYKENTTPNRIFASGVRKAESTKRSGYDTFLKIENTLKDARFYSLERLKEVYADAQEKDEVWDCRIITAAKQNANLQSNPIIDFTDDDVWKYIRDNGIKYNPLYDRGYKRVGCVGCPMAGGGAGARNCQTIPA